MTLAAMMNQFNWSQDKPLREWIRNNRLDGFTKLTSGVNPNDKEKMDILMRMRDTAPKAVSNLMKLAEQIPTYLRPTQITCRICRPLAFLET